MGSLIFINTFRAEGFVLAVGSIMTDEEDAANVWATCMLQLNPGSRSDSPSTCRAHRLADRRAESPTAAFNDAK